MVQVTASEVMTRNVLAVGPDWPIDDLVAFLNNHAISGAPVLAEDGTPIGVVSLTDLARHGGLADRSHGPDTHAYYAQGLDTMRAHVELASYRVNLESQATVRDIMTPLVFSVKANATVREVADTMVTGRIHRVLVTQENRVVGIISSLDLVRLVRAM